MKKAILALWLLLAAAPAHADDAMTAAANTFYTVSTAERPSSGGGIPDATGRTRYAPLLSARLNRMLADAAAAQTRFMAKAPNAPPMIEGDIFTSLFDGPTGWKMGACSGDSRAARCTVSLVRQAAGQKPLGWTDTLVLVNEGGWKVDDVVYDPDLAAGNTGSLSETLKMVLGAAP